MTIHVVIADDHPIVRSGIRSELSRHRTEFEVVGEAISGDEALFIIKSLHPDVLLLDVNMPGLKAIEVIQDVKKEVFDCRVIVLTAYGDTATILGVLNAGADGFLLKDDDPIVLPEAIHSVLKGGIWLSQAVSEKLALVMKNQQDGVLGRPLTRRELEVLRLLQEGCSNKKIAITLQTTERTVEFHIGNILNKLGVNSRLEAVVWAKEHGLL